MTEEGNGAKMGRHVRSYGDRRESVDRVLRLGDSMGLLPRPEPRHVC